METTSTPLPNASASLDASAGRPLPKSAIPSYRIEQVNGGHAADTAPDGDRFPGDVSVFTIMGVLALATLIAGLLLWSGM